MGKRQYKILFLEQLFWTNPALSFLCLQSYLLSQGIKSKIYYPLNNGENDKMMRRFFLLIKVFFDPQSKVYHEFIQDIIDDLMEYEFEWLGWTYFFTQSNERACFLEIVKELKKRRPYLKVVVGGQAATLIPEVLLEKLSFIDCVVCGEGELTLHELLITEKDNWGGIKGICYRKNGQFVRTDSRPLIKDLDALPFPARDYSVFDIDDGIKITTSRGCYGRCSFCTIHAFYEKMSGHHWRARSPQNIIKEINCAFKESNPKKIKYVMICEDTIVGPGLRGCQRIRELFDLINKSQHWIKINFICRTNDMTAEIFNLIKDNVFTIEIGIESFQDSNLQFFNKGHTRSDVIRVVSLLREASAYNVPVHWDFIIYHPYLAVETLEKEIKDLKEYILPFSVTEPCFFLNALILYVGQPVLKKIQQENPQLLYPVGSDPLGVEYKYKYFDKSTEMVAQEMFECIGGCFKNYWSSLQMQIKSKNDLLEILRKNPLLPELNKEQKSWIFKRGLVATEACINAVKDPTKKNMKEKEDKLFQLRISRELSLPFRSMCHKSDYKIINVFKEINKALYIPEANYLNSVKQMLPDDIQLKARYKTNMGDDGLIPELGTSFLGKMRLRTIIFDFTRKKYSAKVLLNCLRFSFDQNIHDKIDIHIQVNKKKDIVFFDAIMLEFTKQNMAKIRGVNVSFFMFYLNDDFNYNEIKKDLCFNYCFVLSFYMVANKIAFDGVKDADILIKIDDSDMKLKYFSKFKKVVLKQKRPFFYGMELCGEICDFSNMKMTKMQWDFIKRAFLELKKQGDLDLCWNLASAIGRDSVRLFHCKPGKELIYISANGDIYPCPKMVFKKYKIGNVFDPNNVAKELVDSYEDYYVNYLKECKDCWARYLCAGGCIMSKSDRGTVKGKCNTRKKFFESGLHLASSGSVNE